MYCLNLASKFSATILRRDTVLARLVIKVSDRNMPENNTIVSKTLSLRVIGAMNPAIHDTRWYAPLVSGAGGISGSTQNGKSSVSFQSTTITTDFGSWDAKTQVHNLAEINAEADKLISLARTIFVERLAHTPTTGLQLEFGYKYANEEYNFPDLWRTKFPIFDVKSNGSGATFFALWEASEAVGATTRQSRVWACNKSWHLHFSHIFDFSTYGKKSDDFDLQACLNEVESAKVEALIISDRASESVLGEVTNAGVHS